MNLLVFTGQFGVGKDHAAESAGCEKLSIVEPLYSAARILIGHCDKNDPTIRQFLQTAGSWARGEDAPDLPNGLTRSKCADFFKNIGPSLADGYEKCDWSMFGKSKTFLLDAAVQIAKNRTEANPDLKLGVVNARFDYELKAFTQGGFKHYHVRCSEETRIDRVGGSLSPKLSNDVTEQFAIQLNQTMVGKNVIWNDTKPMPPGAQFSTLQEVVDNETSRPTLSKTSSFHLQSTEKANQAKKSSLSVSLA